MKISNILLGMLFLFNNNLLATQKKVENMIKEHPFWTCERIAGGIATYAFSASAKVGLSATTASGPWGVIVGPAAFVSTIGFTGWTYYMYYESCLGVKKEIARMKKKGHFTWKGYHGDDFDWAGN